MVILISQPIKESQITMCCFSRLHYNTQIQFQDNYYKVLEMSETAMRERLEEMEALTASL